MYSPVFGLNSYTLSLLSKQTSWLSLKRLQTQINTVMVAGLLHIFVVGTLNEVFSQNSQHFNPLSDLGSGGHKVPARVLWVITHPRQRSKCLLEDPQIISNIRVRWIIKEAAARGECCHSLYSLLIRVVHRWCSSSAEVAAEGAYTASVCGCT